jgi:hypothetical protein
MAAKLFDGFERSNVRPRRHSESRFNFLNESARPQAAMVRSRLERWFTDYPSDGCNDLRQRFRSPCDWQHHGAFFELFCHELLRGFGYSLQVHPATSADEHCPRPDFLVSTPTANFYFECTVIVAAESERSREARANQVYDTLNRMSSPDFFLSLEVRGAPESSPPGRRLAAELGAWISSLSWEDLTKTVAEQQWESLPVFTWSWRGWEIDFTPIPKSLEARGRGGLRPIAGMMGEMRRIDDVSPIRASVTRKARKYGRLPYPLVVFVNALPNFADESDLIDALFGTSCIKATEYVNGKFTWREARIADGVFRGSTGPSNRVSAVAAVFQLEPWSIDEAKPALCHNPWAETPLPPGVWPLTEFAPSEGWETLERRVGANVREFLRGPE